MPSINPFAMRCNVPISDVKHQDRAQRLIRRALVGGRLPHAYIFHGPDGVGKELFANRLARILLCENRTEPDADDSSEGDIQTPDACGACKSCHLIAAGNHPDLHLVHRHLNVHHPDPAVRAKKAFDLGVDVVRHFVIDACGIKPGMGRAKVFVIREADRITVAAQNALLKTLEEPPSTTYLILLAASVDRLLATTRSRCQQIPFGLLPTGFVAQRLRSIVGEISDEDAGLYAALAGGSLGNAVKFAQQQLKTVNQQVHALVVGLSRTNALEAATQVIEIAKSQAGAFREEDPSLSEAAALRRGLSLVFDLISTVYRDALHLLCDTNHLVVNEWAVDALSQLGDRISTESLAAIIPAVARAEWTLERNVNTQLAVESLMFELVNIAEGQRSTVAMI